MRTATCYLESLSPLSMSRKHDEPKLPKEAADAYEERTWIERGHYTPEGEVFIPAMALKFALASAAKRLAIQMPGRGKTTYTKFFESGVQVTEGPVLHGWTRDNIVKQKINAHANGIRGSGKRVNRYFPTVPEWKAEVEFYVLAGEITKEVFAEVLQSCGLFIGIGQFRPENQGLNGRFKATKIVWGELDLAALAAE